jgi:hypothetical protein
VCVCVGVCVCPSLSILLWGSAAFQLSDLLLQPTHTDTDRHRQTSDQLGSEGGNKRGMDGGGGGGEGGREGGREGGIKRERERDR